MSNELEVGKFIVFMIADYLVALPMVTVLKVVNYPPGLNGNLRSAGIIQIGQHPIAILDLHHKFTNSYAPQLTRNSPFLVITQMVRGELCGIPVDETPNIVDLPRDSIRALPKSYHQLGQINLDIFSHVAVLSEEEKTFTIFLLDINRLLSAATKSNTPRLITAEEQLLRGE